MEDSLTGRLDKCILDFLQKKINGVEFEEAFSEIYDFEDLPEAYENSRSLKEIRKILERFSPDSEDLRNYKEFYIDEKQLRIKIKTIIAST